MILTHLWELVEHKLTRSHVPCEVICSRERALAGGALEQPLWLFRICRCQIMRLRRRGLHVHRDVALNGSLEASGSEVECCGEGDRVEEPPLGC